MNKIIKKISFVITSIGVILLLGGVISSVFFSEKIENTVIDNLKNQIPNNISIGSVKFQLFNDFPFSIVKIENFYVEEDEPFGSDTLIYAETAFVTFSLIEFIFKTYSIDNISIFNGEISIKEKNNTSNYNFLKGEKNSKNEIKLGKIKLYNSTVNYKSEKNKTDILLLNTNMNISIEADQTFLIDGVCISEKIKIQEKEYLSNKQVELNVKYIYEDGNSNLKNSFIQIEDLKFFVNGLIDKNKYLDLDIVGSNQNIKSFTQHTPVFLQETFKSVLMNGEINYSASIKGKFKSGKNPSLNINYDITNGVFETKRYPFYLSEISCHGIVKNGDNNNFSSSSIDFKNFTAKTKKGNVKGEFLISDLKNYFLETNLISTWEMSEANYYFSESPFYECSGKINATTKYEGKISFDETFNKHFLNSKHFSDIELIDISFLYKNYPNRIKINNAKGVIINDSIQITNSVINIKDSDVNYEGSIKNLFSYILINENKIELDGNVYSKTMNLKNIIGIDETKENGEDEFIMPNYLKLKLKSDIETLVYNNVYPNKIKGNFIFNNNSLSTKDLELNIFDGRLFLDGKFYKNEKNNFKLTSNIKLEKIDVKKAFSAFDNFGQDFIIDKHIKGLSSSNLICNMYWDPYLNLNYESIDVNSKIVIEKGELINFKPLESLSSYVKLKDLAHIKFSKLENEIKIKDKIISVPNMEINSSALSLIISGKHFFNQEYNYKVSLLLSELLAKRFRAKSSSFNPNDSISPLKTNLQIRMKGTKDDSEIYFEKLKIKENIEQEIKKEIIDVKKIIAEELNKKEKEEESEDLEIEWDDEP